MRSRPIEATLAELKGVKLHPYLPPTISTNVGNLTPDRRSAMWLIGEGEPYDGVADGIVGAVTEYGLPFARGHVSLEAIHETMASGGYGTRESAAYRLPVAALLLGRDEEARSYVDHFLRRLAQRQDPAAELYRRFAASILDRLDGAAL